ncbi:MAG: YkgJ family cysteine cluster protein, partial [Sphingomicrobium sp.]
HLAFAFATPCFASAGAGVRCRLMASASIPPPELDAASTLCTSCGLCCEGALHGHAVLRPDELNRARELGLSIMDGDAPGFYLPCPKLLDRCCSIYGERPSVCAGYKCQLLIDLGSERVSLDDALAKVAVARSMFDAFAADKLAPQPATAVEAGARILRLTALRLYLDKHFVNADDARLVSQSVIGELEPEAGSR